MSGEPKNSAYSRKVLNWFPALLESAKMRAIKILKDESKSEQDRIKYSKMSLLCDFQKIERSKFDLNLIITCTNNCSNEQFIRDFS